MHSHEDEEREGVSEQKQGGREGGGLTQILCLRDLHGPRDLCGSNPSVVTVLNRGHNICLDPAGRNTLNCASRVCCSNKHFSGHTFQIKQLW